MGSCRGWARALLGAVVASVGCAKGESIPDGVSSFGVGDDNGSATMTTADTGTSADAETSAPETCGDGACSESCGNGELDPGEQCDGAALSGNCTSVGFLGGTIECAADCTFDTSGCTSAACGDGMLQDGETCDCGMMGAACTPAQLGNQTCMNLPAPSGGNYSGGTLGCNVASCTFNETGCFACGNGVLDMGEQCDGANLAGATCSTQGFDAGTLACSATCMFNTGSCVDWVCGNLSCEPNEDSCSCPADCPDDPNTCGVPCQCGLSGGNCYCDEACISFGDCCPNGPC
jgi:hypothetical protein